MSMKNNDYKVEFEEHRREIELDHNDGAVLPSRAERHGKRRKRKKSSSHTTINVILGIFTFIPIFIFVYVIYNFYFGSDSGSAKVDNSEIPVEFGTNAPTGKSEGPGTVVIGSEEEDDEQSTEDANKGSAEESAEESKKKPVNENPSTVEKVEKKETPKETKPPKVEEKPKTENKTENTTNARTHIVAADETLYRISMNYYGTDAGIDKIKKANGLSSNDIMAGQKLIIP
jgi:LysM repeat protein